jgi:hypothetical protein
LSDNDIRDISALAELTNLTRLDLSGNDASDFGALLNLINLTFLDLGLYDDLYDGKDVTIDDVNILALEDMGVYIQ